MAKLMCNVYLWCDYFILAGCAFEFHFEATTIHNHLVCNRHQDYCYYRAAAASAFGAAIVVFRNFFEAFLCIDETVPFYIPSRRFVCTQICCYYIIL